LLVAAVAIAALGATMVLAYVRSHSGAETATTGATAGTVKVLTATSMISTGESAGQAQSEGKFVLTAIPASNVVPGAVTSIDSMNNMVALAPVYPGEQILTAMFGSTAASEQALPVPNGKMAVSVELTDPGRVAGFVTPGSHVAIFLSLGGSGGGSDSGDFTRALVQNAEVLAVGPTTLISGADGSSTANNSDVDNTILTVALNEFDANQVLYGSDRGTISFALLGHDTPVSRDHGVTIKDVR
jgi:pilus assembly protein CpaB